jgi:hypothetical protein
VGIGDPLEAPFSLVAPVSAGNWHLVADAIIFQTCDVTFDLLWRSAMGDQTIASWSQHFDAPPTGPGQFDALPFEADASAPAVPAQPGDQLVWRFTVTSAAATGGAYIPNSHGAQANGRIPSVTLPP